MGNDITSQVNKALLPDASGAVSLTASEAEAILKGFTSSAHPEALSNALARQNNAARDVVSRATNDPTQHTRALQLIDAQVSLINNMPLRNDDDRFGCCNSAWSLGRAAESEANTLYERAAMMEPGPARTALMSRARELHAAAQSLVNAAERHVGDYARSQPDFVGFKVQLNANNARFAD